MILSTTYPQNPTFTDSALIEINEFLLEKISWLNSAFGKAEKLIRKNEKQLIYYPGVFAGNNETMKNDYQNVLPNDQIGNFSFWTFEDPSKVNSYTGGLHSIEINGSLIFWFDLRNIFPTDPGRNIEQVKQTILETLVSGMFKKSRFTVDEITERAENVYKGFTISEINSQFAMHPFGCLKFSGKLIVKPFC